jgi:hypothetical protein
VLKNGLHVGGEGRARMIAGDQPTSAQQVCHTRLMSGVGKLPIGRPAITDQDPVEVPWTSNWRTTTRVTGSSS